MTEAIHCFATASVRFAIYPDGFDGARMIAQIGEDALRDHFGARGGPDSLVEAYERNASRIDALAVSMQRETPDEAVLLKPGHFDTLLRMNGPPDRATARTPSMTESSGNLALA